MMTKRIIVLLGPPGTGKGTQAAFLAKILHIPVVSTGNILRAECASGTPLGESVEEMLRAGVLVPDEMRRPTAPCSIVTAACIALMDAAIPALCSMPLKPHWPRTPSSADGLR